MAILIRLKHSGLLAFAALLALTFAAAAIGAAASLDAAAFYGTLTLPSWAPPAGVFGPVWTALYVLIAAAAYVALRAGEPESIRRPLVAWVVQLVLNAAWTWLFFALRSGMAALIDIATLFVVLAALVVAFWRVRPLAGALLVPYLAWVGFASALTVSVWRLNPGLL